MVHVKYICCNCLLYLFIPFATSTAMQGLVMWKASYLILFRIPAAKSGDIKYKWYTLITLKIPPYAAFLVYEYLMESSLMIFISESIGTKNAISFIIFNRDCLTSLFKILSHGREWRFLW